MAQPDKIEFHSSLLFIGWMHYVIANIAVLKCLAISAWHICNGYPHTNQKNKKPKNQKNKKKKKNKKTRPNTLHLTPSPWGVQSCFFCFFVFLVFWFLVFLVFACPTSSATTDSAWQSLLGTSAMAIHTQTKKPKNQKTKKNKKNKKTRPNTLHLTPSPWGVQSCFFCFLVFWFLGFLFFCFFGFCLPDL